MTVIILTTILISLIFAPLGCISIWKKYVYLADGLAHASLLVGVTSSLLNLPLTLSSIIISIFFAVLIFIIKSYSSTISAVSLVSISMLSLALLINYKSDSPINLDNFLFGDIFSATIFDLYFLSLLLIIVIIFIYYSYSHLMLLIVNKDIAQIMGVRVKALELSFLIVLSLSVSCTIKIVGALLVGNALLIPPMTARFIASTPLGMIIGAVLIALSVNMIALFLSFHFDLPIAPLMIILSVISYVITCLVKYKA